MFTINSPFGLTWYEGNLPDVNNVPKNCAILAFCIYDFSSEDSKQWKSLKPFLDENAKPDDFHGKFSRFVTCKPWKDELNPLSWWPGIGSYEKVAYWAWIKY